MRIKKAKKRKVKIELDHAICHLSVIPVRRHPEDQSEIVTQLLYGETCQIIKRKNRSWVKILLDYDSYEGWVDPKQLYFITAEEHEKYSITTAHCLEYAQAIISDDVSQPILMGSSLPHFDGMNYKLPSGKYIFSGQVLDSADISLTPEIITKISCKYLNAPYLWGGRSPFGIDCSGFTQIVFKMLGIYLPRDACQQAVLGETIDFVEASAIGDLAYFVNKDGKVIHVGIVLPDNKIIHASGRVRIDYLDHYGIYNLEAKKYSHVLRVIKRVI